MTDIRVAFFTEAGYSRGMGHLIRSFTISKKFQSRGIKTFLFLDSNLSFDDKFKGITYFSWKDFKLIEDYDIIFIDSYEASIEIYHKISEFTEKIRQAASGSAHPVTESVSVIRLMTFI